MKCGQGGIPRPSIRVSGLLGVALVIMACRNHAVPGAGTHSAGLPGGLETSVDSAFPGVPDSAWIELTGPALIAFYPVASNEELEADEGLASTLDDLAYYLGTAMDSLVAAGIRVSYHAGDTVWLRAGHDGTRFVRHPDSAAVGYLYADTSGHRAVVYGVRTTGDLLDDARRFARTGRLTAQ